MPPAIPVRTRRPHRRLLVRKPGRLEPRFRLMEPGPGGRPLPYETFGRAVARLRALPPGEYELAALHPLFPAPKGRPNELAANYGTEVTVGPAGDLNIEAWVPSATPGELED